MSAALGLDAERNRQACLAGASWSEVDHVLLLGREVALGGFADKGPVEAALVGEGPVVEGLALGRPSCTHACLASTALPCGHLDREDLGKKLEMVPALLTCSLCD